jgi:hypothetical protein
LCQSTENWNFTITSPPLPKTKLEKEQIVELKENIELSVKVEGFPPPTVKWFKNGNLISPNDPRIKTIVDGNNYTLKIQGANQDDTALYTVEFSNENGTIKDECQVHVKCPPRLKESMKDVTVNEGDKNTELYLAVDCYPK